VDAVQFVVEFLGLVLVGNVVTIGNATGSDTAPCWRLTERIAKRN
jgi:hypothetical protein